MEKPSEHMKKLLQAQVELESSVGSPACDRTLDKSHQLLLPLGFV